MYAWNHRCWRADGSGELTLCIMNVVDQVPVGRGTILAIITIVSALAHFRVLLSEIGMVSTWIQTQKETVNDFTYYLSSWQPNKSDFQIQRDKITH